MDKIGKVLFVLFSFFIISCDNPTLTYLAEKEVNIFAHYEIDWTKEEPIDVLKKGSRGKILGVNYSKDAKFYKIEYDNGKKGYIIWDDVRTVERN